MMLSNEFIGPSMNASVQQIPVDESPNKDKYAFIYDAYTGVRGAPAMLEISCINCHSWIMDYQKDGPGPLLRCYLDRIHNPIALRDKTFTEEGLSFVEALSCRECQIIVGIPMIYKKEANLLRNRVHEHRPAYLIATEEVLNSDGEIVHMSKVNYSEKCT